MTTTKEVLLHQEYDAWQSWLRGNQDASLYSDTKQQASRLLRSLDKRFNKNKLYPMILRNDCVRLERAKEATWSEWWFKIPVACLRGGLWCPIQMPRRQEHLIEECSIRECKLIRKGDHWSLHIMVQKEVEEPLINPFQPILAVDLGEVRPATAVLLSDERYSGHILADKKVREIRMHYNWLRQKIGKRKLLRVIKKMGRSEKRKIDAQLIQSEASSHAIISHGSVHRVQGTMVWSLGLQDRRSLDFKDLSRLRYHWA